MLGLSNLLLKLAKQVVNASFRNHHLDLLIVEQPNSFCHFLVLSTFEHLNSSMLTAYDNWIWCDLEFHGDGRSVKLSNLFVTLGVISHYR